MVFFSRIDLCLYTQKKKCEIILGSRERMSEESCPLPVMIFFFLDLNREIYITEYLSAVLNCKVEPTPCISLNMEGLEKTDTIVYENLSKFKGEVGNSPKLVELLSSGVNIFVNDSFSQSHKMFVSTVGITRFCYASLAGFHFEESLYKLRNASGTCR
ncbi:hypothetical protein SAY87_022681 [Trapa incisa]|uniref:phosphoglycerate kinase n=1 Tax=Trapa incisa TaxID=236973 RepID=A0AAN7KAL1_9MYRT|nr:hypothetical protein SAY87_022681 [Trapa incisa]